MDRLSRSALTLRLSGKTLRFLHWVQEDSVLMA